MKQRERREKGEKRERNRRFLPTLIAASTAAVGHARVVGRHAARRAKWEKEDGTSGVRDRDKFPESRV